VVIHHWIFFIPHQSTNPLFYITAELIESITGTSVHLFFILSGCGLTLSHLKKGTVLWKDWAKRRIRKIIIPYWIIIIFTFFLANYTYHIWPELIKNNYTWKSLFTYLTLTSNFYNPSWGLNPTLWFMSVIIGLYVLFPLLIKIMKNFGIFALLTFSVFVTYISITLSIIFGYTITHQTALPFFYLSEFALGIFIGYLLYKQPHHFKRFVSSKMLFLGLFLYGSSWIIAKFWKLGRTYNDLITAIGIFLITLYVCKLLVRYSPDKSVNLLKRLSKQSYMMYLIHGALILFVINPILVKTKNYPLNSGLTLIFSIAYCSGIFIVAKLLSKPMKLLIFRLFKTY
jgi:peptidoglycan/LPS O-acetylase OafA/YrhL